MSEVSKAARRKTDRQHRRPTIGVLIDRIFAGYQGTVWHGAVDLARAQDVNLLCFTGGILRSRSEPEARRNVLYDLACTENVDGLVIVSGTIGTEMSLEAMQAFCDRYRPLPMVSIAMPLQGIPSVLPDNYHSMRRVVAHLVEAHGYCKIGFIRKYEGHPEADARYRAYSDVLTERGLPIDLNLVVPGTYYDDVAAGLRLLFEERKLRPQVDLQALVAVDDYTAARVLPILSDRGIRTPDDVALAGFDDVEESKYLAPPLTTARQPLHGLGRRAVELVLAQLRGEEVPAQVLLHAELIVRQSCGCLDPLVMQTATEPVTDSLTRRREPFAETFATCREAVLAAMRQALRPGEDSPAAGKVLECAGQVLDAFALDLTGEAPGSFLTMLYKVLRQGMFSGDAVDRWQEAIARLRRHALACFDDNAVLLRAETLWEQARGLIAETARQLQGYRWLQAEQQAQTLREIGQTLITTFNIDELMNILAEGLPRLGIPSCYLGLYEHPAATSRWSRLILAYHEQGRVKLEPEGCRFPSHALTPQELLPQNRSYRFQVELLSFREEQIGVGLFEVGPPDGKVYDILRGEISSALQGALLLEARKQAEKELKTHRNHLEELVQARTAELTSANERLRQEIAEREKAEAALLESERQLADIISFLPDPTLVIDRAGQVIAWNRALENLTGVSAAAMLGKGNYEYALPFYGERRPILIDLVLLSRAELEQHYARLTREGDLLMGETYVPHLRGGGVYLFATASALHDSKGAIVGAIETIRDITDRKHAEEELQRHRERLADLVNERTAELTRANADLQQKIVERQLAEQTIQQQNTFLHTIINSLPHPFYVINATDYTVQIANNTAHAAGITVGGRCYTATHRRETPCDGSADPCPLKIVRQTRAPVVVEHLHYNAAGQQIYVEVHGYPILNAHGEVVQMIEYAIDITMRKQAEKDLQRHHAELTLLNRVSQLFNSSIKLTQVLETVLGEMCRLLKISASSFWLCVPETGELVCQQATGPGREIVLGWRLAAGQGITGATAQTGATMRIEDLRDNPRHYKVIEQRIGITYCSLLSIPVKVKDDVIGVLDLMDTAVARFTADEVRLAESVAAVAASAVENARLFTEEHRQRQIGESLRQVATVVNASLDQATVFARILEQLQRVVAYDSAAVFLQEGRELVLSDGVHIRPEYLGSRMPLDGNSLEAEAVHTRAAIIIPDVLRDPRWEVWSPTEQIRSWMGAPLFVGDSVIGLLTVDHFKVGAYGEEDAQMLQTFANQAALAIQNARLYTLAQQELAERKRAEAELRESQQQLQASYQRELERRQLSDTLRDIAKIVSGALEQQKVVVLIFDHLKYVVAYHYAIVLLLQEGQLTRIMRRNWQGDSFAPLTIPATRYQLNAAALQEKHPIVIPDVRDYALWEPSPETKELRSFLVTPLLVQDQPIGILCVGRTDPIPYTEDDAQTVFAFATQVAIALENARLVEQTRKTLGELETTLDDLKKTQKQLVESEKMAALGKLIANIAHEINTPLGAIRAAMTNITHALAATTRQLPALLPQLAQADQQAFWTFVARAVQPQPALTTREERQRKRGLCAALATHGIPQAEELADVLGDMGVFDEMTPYLALFQQTQAPGLLQAARDLVMQHRNSETIFTAVERMAKIIFALKTYAHYDAAGQQTTAHIAEGLEVALTLYQNQLKHGIAVRKQYADVPAIYCYPDELNQVWTNLIHNAIQAMAGKGTLEITVRPTPIPSQEGKIETPLPSTSSGHRLGGNGGGWIVVQITDSGCGIPESIKDRIFEPFFTTKPAGEGSGLGLDIVKRIIAKHQGRIDFESQPGRTTFNVFLPLRPAK